MLLGVSALAVTAVGGEGADHVVMTFEGEEATLVPMALLHITVKV